MSTRCGLSRWTSDRAIAADFRTNPAKKLYMWGTPRSWPALLLQCSGRPKRRSTADAAGLEERRRMSNAEEFRRNAVQCSHLAKATGSDSERDQWSKLQRFWLHLAEQEDQRSRVIDGDTSPD